MALSKDRNTLHRTIGLLNRYPVAAATKIYAGAQVCVNAAGELVPGANAAGLRAVGRAAEQVDNTGAAGALSCDVQEGVFKWANSATKAIEAGDVGRYAYVEDDQTVADETTKGIVAGIVLEVETDGIWVGTFTAMAVPLELGTETVIAAGAISPHTRSTRLEVTGTVAYTLADGIYEGQRKSIVCKVAATVPVGTVTPTTVSAPDTTYVFKAVNDFVELEWHFTGGWRRIAGVLTP